MNTPSYLKIRRSPKAELHVHLEGTIEHEMLFNLAKRNAISLPYRDLAGLKAAYHFSSLNDFLSIYYTGLKVMVTKQDFYDVTLAYLESASRENVIHAELYTSPQSHLERGIPMSTMMDGMLEAIDYALDNFGISAHLIFGLQRHRTEAEALDAMDAVLPYRDRIIALGLGGPELGNAPSKFREAFARARDLGWRTTVHAGEEGPASYIYEALDVLKADRIDHGVQCESDAALVQHLSDSKISLTVCPISNVKLKVFKTLGEHPLGRLLDAGCRVSVNADDPSYFGANVSDNLHQVSVALDLNEQQVLTLLRNGFESAFCDDMTRMKYIRVLEHEWLC